MSKEKPKPEKMTDLEYLEASKQVFEDMLTKNYDRLKIIKKDLEEVQEDISRMTNQNLKKASMNAFNQLSKEKRQRLNQVKEVRNDLVHVRSIIKTLKKVK